MIFFSLIYLVYYSDLPVSSGSFLWFWNKNDEKINSESNNDAILTRKSRAANQRAPKILT